MGDENKNTHSERIKYKVLGYDNTTIKFNTPKDQPFGKMMKAYCDRTEMSMQEVGFRFHGNAINEHDTPATLDMKPGDIIEVYCR